MSKRNEGDVSRRRRFADPVRRQWYATYRQRRFARRCLGGPNQAANGALAASKSEPRGAVSSQEMEAPWFAPVELLELPACIQVVEKVAREIGLSPDEQSAALAGLVQEAERRAPQIVTVLFVLAVLPVIGTRAFKHFRHSKQESRHQAEEMSQEMVLKTMSALTRAWPRGNVGAWLAEIRENIYRDYRRKHRREAESMERLETAFHTFRRD